MRQVEVSRTNVFDAPRHARGFFEALCTANVDIGRPQEMQVIFGRRVRRPPVGGYRTRLLRSGDEVTLNAYFRHSRVKSYLTCGRAFRIETVINDTGDLGLLRGLEHLEELSVKARGRQPPHGRCFCVSVRVVSLRAQPLSGSRDHPWWRVGGPRPCGSATLGSWPCPGALCALVHTITGFTNRSLRAQVATLLGVPYSMSQMSYDLRRLRLKGLITRLPHTNTYVLTDEGQRVVIFYTKLHNRLLRPLLAAHDPPAPLPLRQALRVINHHVEDYITQARMTA
jgi:hypothetical protein